MAVVLSARGLGAARVSPGRNPASGCSTRLCPPSSQWDAALRDRGVAGPIKIECIRPGSRAGDSFRPHAGRSRDIGGQPPGRPPTNLTHVVSAETCVTCEAFHTGVSRPTRGTGGYEEVTQCLDRRQPNPARTPLPATDGA